MTWERARSQEQKEQRIDEIVQATARLYERHTLEDITFASIAKEADFSRSNLYKYFNTKEEVFLELLRYDISRWRKETAELFGGTKYTVESFAAAWVDLLLKQDRMIRLLSILFTTLEKNASLESLIDFKRRMMEEIGHLTTLLEEVFPSIPEQGRTEFMFAQMAVAIGACPMMNMSEKQREAAIAVGSVADLDYYRTIFVHTVQSLLRGLLEAQAE
jgi:AcrR family transcriptional regulator